MELSEYPRPPADNGRGVHWSPSQYQWGRQDWLKWQQRILAMGLKWVKVNVPPDYNAEAIVKRLVDIEVMPVCRYIVKNPARISADIEGSIDRLIKLGARYFETNNEPDADVEWVGFRRPAGWEELVVKNLIEDANRIQNMGGIPAFVAFNSGPDEPRNPLQILTQQPGGRDILARGLWISLHNYGKGRPFNYPNDRIRMFGDPITDEAWTNQGQPNFWSQERLEREVWRGLSRAQIDHLRAQQKDSTITIMTDITCFRAYEYWHQLCLAEGLDSLPIMMTEGGWETDDGLDNFYPQPTAVVASRLNLKMFQFIQGDLEMVTYKPDGSTESNSAPDYLFALMPWHMGEKAFGLDTSGQWEQGAWFSNWHDEKYGLDGALPIIQMLRDLPSKVRVNGPVPAEWHLRQGLTPPTLEQWDYRLNYLGDGIRVEAVNAAGPVWDLVAGYWQDNNEQNASYPLSPGYIMVKLLAEDGTSIPDAKVEISRGHVSDVIMTKGEIDGYLGNYRMTATLGTYTLQVLHQNYPSTKVLALGLGGETPGSDFDLTSFLFIFQLKTPEMLETSPPKVEPKALVQPVEEASQDTLSLPIVDNEAEHLGVKVLSAPPQAACLVTSVHLYTAAERMPPSTLYLDLVDQAGQRQYGATILVQDETGQILRVPIEKPANEPGGNMPMWPNNGYDIVGVLIGDDQKSVQSVTNLRSIYPNQGEGHSFLVVLRRTQ